MLPTVGAELQAEMTGDFFVDDGMGAVVDSSGNTQLNDEKKTNPHNGRIQRI
jgi:hypothetical protein